MPANILIIDDHRFITEYATLILQPACSVVAAHNIAEANAALQRMKFSAVILDLNLNGSSGFDLLPAILMNTQNVIIFYDALNDEDLSSCRRWGVSAFVGKHAKASVLVDGVKGVIAGRQVIPVEWVDAPSLLPEMKAQQWMVLIGVFSSPPKSTKAIAAELGFAAGSVTSIKTGLFKLFGVRNLAELLEEARRLGYRDGDRKAQQIIAAYKNRVKKPKLDSRLKNAQTAPPDAD